MDADIRRLEEEVISARAKLAVGLSQLRSQQPYEEFGETARELFVDKVKQHSQTAWQGMIDNLKARVAENPAATLAIAAGLAWRSYRHPPLATALIGGGLYSLLRTSVDHANVVEMDHVARAKMRLQQQATALAGSVTEGALDVASDLKSSASEFAETVTEQSAQVAGAATDKVQEWAAKANEALRSHRTHGALLAPKPMARDNLLLGVAGVAVFAALGLAYRRNDDRHQDAEH